MRTSIIVPSHNEGALLWKTVDSCLKTTRRLDCEIVMADDASTDGSLEETERRYPEVRVFRTKSRRGCPYTKDLGARKARGDVLVFIDGHSKPEPGAIPRLVRDVERLDGDAVVTPRIPYLHTRAWENRLYSVGYGFFFELRTFECGWLDLDRMTRRGRFFESPSLVGCCVATSRKLYDDVKGFDPGMIQWGIEDIDFSLKAWLMGYPVLHDPTAAIGHRFRARPAPYRVDPESIIVNKLRMARKNFADSTWDNWLAEFEARHSRKPYSPEFWDRAWALYKSAEETVEREREYLLARRKHDELWYADRFGLSWSGGYSAAWARSS